MIAWNATDRALLARLNAESVERSFVPARDVSWSECTSREEWLALYRAWSLFPGSRFEAELDDDSRANFARYQQATLMLTTAMLERYGLPMLEDLLGMSTDPEFVEYVGHFIKEETYHYVMFMRAVKTIEAEMPGLPPVPRARIERLLKSTFRILRLIPGRRLRVVLSFTIFQFAEQVSMHAHGVAKSVVPRQASFVPQVWAFHALDEGRHLQFDRLLLQRLALSRAAETVVRLVAAPFCAMATLAVHLNEAWAARVLGGSARIWHLLGLLRAPVSPFKQRVVGLMRDVVRPPRTGQRDHKEGRA